MIRAQVFAVVALASVAAVACSRKEDSTTSETQTTSAESIPTVDLRSLPSAPADNAGVDDTAGAPSPNLANGDKDKDKNDGGHVNADFEKKDGGHFGAKPAVPAGHGGSTKTTVDDQVGPGHITTPALPRKAKQASGTGDPNSAGSHNMGQ